MMKKLPVVLELLHVLFVCELLVEMLPHLPVPYEEQNPSGIRDGGDCPS